MSEDLNNLRHKVSAVDSQLVALLNERASISQAIGEAKKANNSDAQSTEIYFPGQEKKVFERIESLNNGPLNEEALRSIYREIMSASISLQKEVTIGFLGPSGTFTHQAAKERFGDSVGYTPIKNIRAIFSAVEEGSITYGVIPFENSTTGTVIENLDPFVEFRLAQIRAEVYLPINQALLSHFQKSGIKRIYSHRVAFSQCSNWLDLHYPHVERVNVESTARAAELASTEMYSAAICSPLCSKIYDLPILNENVADNKYNFTKFVVIGKSIVDETGDDRTFVSFTVDHRIPGALCDGLKVFKDYELNLTKIDTRPAPQKLAPWNYIFFVEFVGHCNNPKVKDALNELSKYCVDIKVLGSYPHQRPSSME
ncbi:bifunctional chorismate mutase/prephenate dehydratase P-protein [Neoconidiobolus thromboides FSU 785]|nr:bifunctional chorismate mutase/prephenate dehydratase P-protein [Neoconidiobolus thromboides FSU 785]